MRLDHRLLHAGLTTTLFLAACGDSSTTPSETGGGTSGATTSTGNGGATSSSSTSTGDTSTSTAASGTGGAGGSAPALTSCPTSGKGAITGSAPCFNFTPEQAGADEVGVNATVAQYALEPSTAAKNGLLVYLNASLASPAIQIADPQKNFYNAAAQAGYHVIALSYRSNDIVGVLCSKDPACFGLVRRTIVTGMLQAGAPASLADMREDEGIVQRLYAALSLVAAARPGKGWDQYRAAPADPDVTKRVAWSKVIAAGHSQGGGHAAYLGLLYPLHRIVQLSSTCDAVNATPVPWTDAAGPWAATPATTFVGFAAPTTIANGTPTGGDTICPYHAKVWQNMGLDPSRMHDDAATCGAPGNTHSAVINCTDNYDAWGMLFE